jgi:hypothetical protein
MSGSIKSQRKPMSRSEMAQMERRVVRAIAQGVTMTDAKSRFRLSDDKIKVICAKYRVEIPKARGRP